MELIKKNIHMNRIKAKAKMQITMDDDFIVSDTKPDVEKIIKDQGNIVITEIKPQLGKVNIKGILEFVLLYFDNEGEINSMNGTIKFDENINMDEVNSMDTVSLKYELEDITTTLVNSRKISVKALVLFKCYSEEMYDEETAVMVNDETAKYITKPMEITQAAINKKDIFRIKDEIMISSGKKNINEILYTDISLLNTEFRLLEEQIGIKGNISAFILYQTDEGDFDYIEKEIGFSDSIELNECNSDMIENISVAIGNREITAKTDEDGESRIIDIEVILDMDIKVYEEMQINIIKDIYSVSKEIKPVFKDAEYECLLVKNNSKFRVNDRVKIDNIYPEVLQICNNPATIKIDDMEVTEDGILVEGAVVVDIIYISQEDMAPINSIEVVLPYSQLVEVKGINDNCFYDVTPYIEHVSVIMLGGREVEIKSAVNLNMIVFEKISEPIIVDVQEDELDIVAKRNEPGITGYIVNDVDTLWSIAKKFHTTVDNIKEINELEQEEISEGDRLLIVKQMDIFNAS